MSETILPYNWHYCFAISLQSHTLSQFVNDGHPFEGDNNTNIISNEKECRASKSNHSQTTIYPRRRLIQSVHQHDPCVPQQQIFTLPSDV
ncbi:hypothetical protein JTE90_013048 [Oedothorax gibbosus]|uniref:Uncharacterized protein n=1 Tax=Oedothorax gibbosus TaxID=931172 RepID=A0AAV6UGD8_9ARAC|nr:hypothetical protein JTE90_013048 [Oedothorax gibbosus]